MRTIYKYQIAIEQDQIIDMPRNSKPLMVAMQNGTINIWMDVETEEKLESNIYSVYGTGLKVKPYDKHIGSVLDGPYVWHIYEGV